MARAFTDGRLIVCPRCHNKVMVFRFAWSSKVCLSCKQEVAKSEWLIG